MFYEHDRRAFSLGKACRNTKWKAIVLRSAIPCLKSNSPVLLGLYSAQSVDLVPTVDTPKAVDMCRQLSTDWNPY